MPSVYSQFKDLDLTNWMLNLQDRFLFLLRIIKRKVCQVFDLPTDDDGERGENKTGTHFPNTCTVYVVQCNSKTGFLNQFN